MEGYDETTYGDRFADVYDDWYGDLTDTDACVATVAELCGGGPVLELGVGTGRLALPLADGGIAVTGVDASRAMLDALAAKPGSDRVATVLGDMADPPTGADRFAVVLVAYNTLFNLVDDGAQARCFRGAAARLADGGCFVVEAFVPNDDAGAVDVVAPKQVTADKVVLSVSRTDPTRQLVTGQYVDITEAGVRLRPWHLRWSTPDQLDEMAAAAGLAPAHRWAGWDRTPFGPTSATHVTVYRPT
ncbi:MAG: class I SAM-dependent methyltransferase [Actinobacteria bacterium]|nr:class I SAM-dependent methyltransferase [Actinomycetota bacterium]